MPVTAKLRFLRIAPRKVRLVADLIRGKSVEEAQTILNFTLKRAAGPLLKLLKQALANAKNNFQLEESNLYISKITVDEGPKYKRWMPRARGQASEIQKKTSHVTLVLAERERELTKPEKGERAKKPIEKTPEELQPPKETKSPAKKAKPKPERKLKRPRIGQEIRKIFRRKAF